MAHIFISHSPADSAAVTALAPTLRKTYDHVSSSPAAGDTLAQSDLVLFISSPDALASEQVQAELAEAARLGKPIQPVQVRVDSDTMTRTGTSLPASVRNVLMQAAPIDLSGGLDDNKRLFALYSAINIALNPPEAEITFDYEVDFGDAFFEDEAEEEQAESAAPPAPPMPLPAMATPSAPPEPGAFNAPPRAAPALDFPLESAIPDPQQRRDISRWIIGLLALIIVALLAVMLFSFQNENRLPDVNTTLEAAATTTPAEISPPLAERASPVLPIFLLALGALVVISLLVWLSRRQSAVPLTRQTTPQVFISYRRDPSWGQARCITNSLREQGITVFMDVDNINEGQFADAIKKAIADCDYFVPVLAPTTLQSEWVRQEVIYALDHRKTIIPLLVDGYKFDPDSLPPDVQDIASHNAITLTHEFYDAAIERLTTRFMRVGA